MSSMNFSKANCKNCYKCVNSCSVKAIKMFENQAEIVDDRCISCGHCLVVCPQNARSIISYNENVKNAILSGRNVVASIAPSFAGFFQHCPPENLVAALKKLGFSRVEETSIGAGIVSKYYSEYINDNKFENLITTSCPSANLLVEKYFPSLVKYLAPVVSPMAAHAKIVKKELGEDTYFVFIGPCISKLTEAAREDAKEVDAVLTFEELVEWIYEEKIDVFNIKPAAFDRVSSSKSSGYPIMGGVLNTININERKLKMIEVDGTDECIEIFKSIEKNDISGVCIEANVCKGGCIGGPYAAKDKTGFYNRMLKVKEYVDYKEKTVNPEEIKIPEGINFKRNFEDKGIKIKIASDVEIKEILEKMGKFEKSDELNCGGCGYNSCREHAQAVYEGMSEAELCLPNLRSKAESFSNVIFENTPNLLFILDKDLYIKELNPTALEVLKLREDQVKGNLINKIFDDDYFMKVKDIKKDLIRHKLYIKKYGITVLLSIVYVPKQDIFIVIMINITKDEKNREELLKVRENTVNAATEVIENQMRVAQEIASLLGETTAETKLILTKLKKIALEDSGDI
ncbi:MAG: 4Fe-4S binding protein [Bacillota bacterium]|nr:4Fe-4S binding protein [Bacillota bacterium]